MSGKYPPRTGVTNWISNASMRLRHEEVTIAEVLKGNGYKTAHIGKWHLAPRGAPDVEDYYPEGEGFDINIGGNHWVLPVAIFILTLAVRGQSARCQKKGRMATSLPTV
jgi:arylsulfatase A